MCVMCVIGSAGGREGSRCKLGKRKRLQQMKAWQRKAGEREKRGKQREQEHG